MQARIAESSSMFLEPRVAVIIHDLINEGITKVGSRVSFNSTSLPLTSPVDRLLPSLPSSDSRRLSVLHLSHINTFNLAGIPYLQSLIRTGLPSRGLYPTSRYSLCSFRKSPEKVQKKSITHNGVPNYTYKVRRDSVSRPLDGPFLLLRQHHHSLPATPPNLLHRRPLPRRDQAVKPQTRPPARQHRQRLRPDRFLRLPSPPQTSLPALGVHGLDLGLVRRRLLVPPGHRVERVVSQLGPGYPAAS